MKYLQLLILNFCFIAYSQVGVNTNDPLATLDVRGTVHNGAVAATDGIAVPRVNRLHLDGIENGQLVYLNRLWNSVPQGFYYWDGSAWLPLVSAGGSAPTTLYSGDDALTGNRTVSIPNHALKIDDNTFTVDGANNKVVIGDASAGNANFQFSGGSPMAGYVLTTDASGNASWTDISGGGGGGGGEALVLYDNPLSSLEDNSPSYSLTLDDTYVQPVEQIYNSKNPTKFEILLPQCNAAAEGKYYLFFRDPFSSSYKASSPSDNFVAQTNFSGNTQNITVPSNGASFEWVVCDGAGTWHVFYQ